MRHTYVFGYGSLVNTATHLHQQTHPAQLRGWRRVWRYLPGRNVATLSITQAEGTVLQGLVAGVAATDWPALDQREALYQRHPVTHLTQHSGPEGQVQTYVVPLADDPAPLPVLLSYLDVVVQGYNHWFGADGVAEFFATTDGWHGGVLDDRAAPLYPRHQPLTAEQRALTDQHLSLLGCKII